MRQEYKDTFNHLVISDEANEKLLQIPQKELNTSSLSKTVKHPVMKMVYAVLIIALISVPTFTVLAANGIDVKAIFGGIFGEKAGLIQDNAGQPQFSVIKDTFEDIDISIRGIAGDKSVIYIILDVERTDGSPFEDDDYSFAYKYMELSKLIQRSSSFEGYKDQAGVIDGVDESSDTSLALLLDDPSTNFQRSEMDFIVRISDDDLTDNRKSFAYIMNMETEVDGEDYYIAGETYVLTLANLIKSEEEIFSGSLFGEEEVISQGVWVGEFVADYVVSDEIYIEVNKIARMPEWKTDDSYLDEHDLLISNITLSSLALRYTCEYDNTFLKPADYWTQLYIEMEDGSIMGVPTFDELAERIITDAPRRMISGGRFNDDPWKYRWVFDEPIDLTKVKTVHIGDLAINVQE